MQLQLQPEHGYVLVVYIVGYLIHNVYMGVTVGMARRKYGVKYPDMYASEANCKDEKARKLFNCIQRGHQNCLENFPSFLAFLGLAGIKYPVVAAIAGAVYLVGKILYFRGYSTGNPNGRMAGFPAYFGLLALLVCTGETAYALIANK